MPNGDGKRTKKCDKIIINLILISEGILQQKYMSKTKE